LSHRSFTVHVHRCTSAVSLEGTPVESVALSTMDSRVLELAKVHVDTDG